MGMDVYGNKPANKAGEYFRANIWSWRPIHKLCETVLKCKLESWGCNDGAGFTTQKECDQLATKLATYLAQFPNEEISIESDMRVDPKTNVFLKRGVKEGVTAYQTSREHVYEFIEFLRSCGGFKIC